MAKHEVLAQTELSEREQKWIEEETIHYNNLVEKMPVYKQYDNLESKCKFWYENRIILDTSWTRLFGNIKVEELECLPKEENEFRYYEEWLLKLYCKELGGTSWEIIEVIPFDNLVEEFKKKLINDVPKKVTIESELLLEKMKLYDYLDKPRIQPNEFYTKDLFTKLMARRPLHEFLPKQFKENAIYKLAIVWDRAKYILYLEKLKEDLENGISMQPSTENVMEGKSSPKDKTLNRYLLKHDAIQHKIEIVWTNENLKTEKKLDKLYLEERKKYASKNKITLSQLNRELKQIDGWNKLKGQIIKRYGQFV